MKKIQIKRDNDMFSFFEDEKLLFSVDSSKKVLDGKTIYEKIYKGIDTSKKIETEIDISNLEVEDVKQFGNYVSELFKSIDASINSILSQEDISDTVQKDS